VKKNNSVEERGERGTNFYYYANETGVGRKRKKKTNDVQGQVATGEK